MIVRGFPPIARPDARILILGSMPGAASLAAGQYYGHPRNAFWPIMGELFGAYPELPYADRVARLREAGIAVWDVLAACHRPGSLDTAIDPASMTVNDFTAFYIEHPRLTHVFFNGSKAAEIYRRRVGIGGPALRQTLPSTSPAHAGRNLAAKLAHWQAVRVALG